MLIDRNLRDIVNNIDSLSLGHVSRLDNPEVMLPKSLLSPMESVVEIWELKRQVEGFRNNIKLLFSELFLHFDDVGAKSVLSCQLKRVREVVNFLALVQVVVHMRFS